MSDTRQARTEEEILEGAIAISREMGIGMWKYLRKPRVEQLKAASQACLAAADAVGRERVSEADRALDDLCIAAIAFGSPSAGARASDDYLAARMRVRAYFTAAPPERHDAPGVTVEWLDEQIAETKKAADHVGVSKLGVVALHGHSERIRTLKEVRNLLTGQPDAKEDRGE